MNLLGLDIGSKRVGVAILIPPNKNPQALTCLDRAQGRAESELLKLIEKYQINLVVAGLPISQDGAETSMSLSVRKFCDRLSKRTSVSLTYVDEWGSSLDAKQRLGVASSGAKARIKGLIDAEAASIILQSFVSQNLSKLNLAPNKEP